jgi:hypothetical protein
MSFFRVSGFLFWMLLIAQLSGCASPSLRMDSRATELGYQKVVVQGKDFKHVAYIKTGQPTDSSMLHVYLEGDGTPWVYKGVAAADPTPRNPLMFELMSLDPAHSLYLGRPCYQGLNTNKSCTSDLWTDRRYSAVVVNSMAAALQRLSVNYDALVLLGHSGGGTLAMLLAEHLIKTEGVITVAANLDTARWAALHKQQPLSGSLNPATRPPLAPRIRQMHFAGEDDDNVPPYLVRDAIAHQHNATLKVIPKQDHRCCWYEVWPEILGELSAD